MPFISKIEARAYARATELLERVETAVSNVFPEDIRVSVSLEVEKVEGQAGDSILIVKGLLENRASCEKVIDFILREIDINGRRALNRSIDLRLDDDSVFFLRLDKQAAFLGKLEITDRADIISVRVHFRDYPRCKKEEAKQMIESLILDAGGK